MPKDLFENDEDPLVTPDPVADPVAELVGDGKKFKTVADLAAGKLESDAFIARLLAEQKELRDDLKARKNLEELADELKTRQATRTSASNELDTKVVNETKSVTPEDIASILDETLAKRDQAGKRKANLDMVAKKLQESLGNGFLEKARQRARQVDPNLTDEDLNNLAARNPNTFLKLLDISDNKREENFNPLESSVDSSTFTPANNGTRNRSYYDKLKATDKEKYYAPATRKQMYEDAMRLGEKFEDK